MGGKYAILDTAETGLLNFDQNNIDYSSMFKDGEMLPNVGDLLLEEFGKHGLTLEHMAMLANNPDSKFNQFFDGPAMSGMIADNVNDIVKYSDGKLSHEDVLTGNLGYEALKNAVLAEDKDQEKAVEAVSPVFIGMGAVVSFSDNGQASAWVKGFNPSASNQDRLSQDAIDAAATAAAGSKIILDASELSSQPTQLNLDTLREAMGQQSPQEVSDGASIKCGQSPNHPSDDGTCLGK